MGSARKRPLHEADGDGAELAKESSLLHRIRNMWQFANLCQWILLFGKVVKIDDNFDVDELETECLKPYSMALQDIGLSLLKFLSSHRGLTHELFEEYSRRQFLAKAPKLNPFGDDETPAKFADFDVFTKIRVLQQMTQLIMMSPEKIREKAEEQKDSDQTEWRIEPYGWDRHDHTYFVLDDNRIYRLTEPPPPAAPPKKNSQKARAAARALKRRRLSAMLDSEDEKTGNEAGDEASEKGKQSAEPQDDDFGGMKWECVAVTLDEVRQFLGTIEKTTNPNQRILRDRVREHLLPILEKQFESRKRKQLQHEKELLNLEKMANAKRSSRIAHKLEQQRTDELAREEERKRREEEAAARKEEQERLKMERERDNKLMSREQRLRDREARRLQHEEELAQLSEDSRNLSSGSGRLSERRLKAEIEKNRQALKEIDEEEEDWMFDCVCGVYGQVDDGSHSVACERCNIWLHSKCLGIKEEDAEREDFHFICDACRQREKSVKEQQQARPRIIKIKVNRPGSSSSPPTQRNQAETVSAEPTSAPHLVVEVPSKPPSSPTEGAGKTQTAVSLGSPNALTTASSAPRLPVAAPRALVPRLPPTGIFKTNPIPTKESSEQPRALPNGLGNNPFSSSHPNLSPPDQSPNKSRAYGTILGQANGLLPNGSLTPAPGPIKPRAESGQEPANILQRPVKSLDAPLARDHAAPTTKISPVSISPPIASAGVPAASSSPNGAPPAVTSTPRFNNGQSRPNHEGQSSPLLPPSSGGLSPTKHSPLLRPQPANGASFGQQLPSSSPTPAILPPVAALSPSPPQQNLTPPMKSAEPARGRPETPQSVNGQVALSLSTAGQTPGQ